MFDEDTTVALSLVVLVPALCLIFGQKAVLLPPRKSAKKAASHGKRSHVAAAAGPPLESAELLSGIKEVQTLMAQDRLLAAGALLERVKAGITLSPGEQKSMRASAELGPWSDKLAARYSTLNERIASLMNDGDGTSAWKSVFDRGGTRTFVKRETGSSLLQIKCESDLSGMRFEHFLATARETHLYHTWFPNTQTSETLQKASRLERVFRNVQCVKLPLVAEIRYDVLLHCFACDAMEERGFFVVSGRSPSQADLPDVPFPPPESGKRIPLDGLVVILEPDLSAGAERMKATMQISFDESRMPMPRWVIDFVASAVVSRIFTSQADKARDLQKSQAPEHADAIAADPDFYANWLPARVDELRARDVQTRYSLQR